MITITPAQASENFERLAQLLLASAPTQKAVEFAERVFAQVRAQGAEWMARHAVELQLLSDHRDDFCPVADNRGYYMARFQMGLLNLQ